MPESPDIRSSVEEAKLILAQHDGAHHVHSDVAALVLMERCAANGTIIDPAEVERILQRMRRADGIGAAVLSDARPLAR